MRRIAICAVSRELTNGVRFGRKDVLQAGISARELMWGSRGLDQVGSGAPDRLPLENSARKHMWSSHFEH